MTKKVLVGMAIGCGALLLLGMVFIAVAFFWVKHKVEGAVEVAKVAEEQQRRSQTLNEKYPFEAPPEGEPLRLEARRLEDYLAIRAAIVPVFKSFEGRAKDFQARHKGKANELGAGLEAMGMTLELIREVRQKWLEKLDERRMSPAEFHAITATVYSSYIGKGVANLQKGAREGLQKTLAELEQRLEEPNLTPEARSALEQQRDMVKEQLDSLPEKGAVEDKAKVWEANAELLEKYKVRIEHEANPALDLFLLSDGVGESFEKGFAPLLIEPKKR